MKLYMIKKHCDNKTVYRAAGVYDKWTISANFVGEILSHIAKLYDFEPKIIYSESHYAKVLENELNITIECKFDY